MKDAAEFIGLGIMVLLIRYGCSHCERTRAEIELMQKQPAITQPENPQ